MDAFYETWKLWLLWPLSLTAIVLFYFLRGPRLLSRRRRRRAR